MRKLTKRFIIKNLNGLKLSKPIRYERYYINDELRIQMKANQYEKEILDKENNVIEKVLISKEEFSKLKELAYSRIIRESYLLIDNSKISIKKYLDTYEGLYRVEVKFDTREEMQAYVKEAWMLDDITNSPLAFDKYLSKLDENSFQKELHKYM